jgi:hypothetical protein
MAGQGPDRVLTSHTQNEEIAGQLEEFIRGILQGYRTVAVLEQEVQLTENLRKVGAVHLIDDQDVRTASVAPCGIGESSERTRD